MEGMMSTKKMLGFGVLEVANKTLLGNDGD